MTGIREVYRFARFARSLYRRARPQYAEIGRYSIRLPLNSPVLNYRRAFHLYDTALAKISVVLYAKYPELRAIDIGANVGDTAALIRESAEIPVLCIEGDKLLLPILLENTARLGKGIEIEQSFVGPEGMAVNLGLANDLGNNTRLVGAADPAGKVRLRSLQAILADHPKFLRSKLLKTDTEGFDFDILRQSLEFVQRAKPVVFFEYAPYLRPDEPRGGLDALDKLVGVGYSDFIYYDNFGNFLLHAGAGDRGIRDDLDGYLASNWRHGIAVHYFDICALHQEDSDLLPTIRSLTQRSSA